MRIRLPEIVAHSVLFSLCLFIVIFPLYRQTVFAPEGTYYTRLHGKLSDYYSYISYIRQGSVQWYQTNQYAIEDTAPRWTHVYYLLLGRIGNWFGSSPFDLYYVGMLFSFLLFYTYTVKLIRLIFPSRSCLLTIVLILFCGPLPPVAGFSIGPELTIASVWWTKMDQYNRLTLIPHHFIAVAFLVAAVYYFLCFLKDSQWRWIGWCLGCITTGTIFFSIPGFIFFLAISCFTILLAYTSSRGFLRSRGDPVGIAGLLRRFTPRNDDRKRLLLGCIIVLLGTFSTQWIMYHLYKSAQSAWIDPMKWEYETHKQETFPTVFSVYLLSFGILLLLLPLSLVATIRKRSGVFVFVWLLFSIPLILYLTSIHGLLPINKLRFVSSAPYVFVGILASHGIQVLFSRISSLTARRVAWCFLILIIGFNIFFGFSAYWLPLTDKREPYKNVFIPKENLEAIDYLNHTAPPYTAVMTNWVSGAYVPAFSFMKVFVGHEFSTPDFQKTQHIADRFYRGEMKAEEANDLLRRYNIAYVLWDRYPLVDAYSSFLTPVYTGKSVILYGVGIR